MLNELVVTPGPAAASGDATEQIPKAEILPPRKPSSWRLYGVAAFALLLTLSLGWGIGVKIQSHQLAKTQKELKTAQKLAAANEMARNDIKVLREEMLALQAKLDKVTRGRSTEETGALEATISSLDKKIEANRTEATSANAQLATKLDKHEKRIEHIETANSDKSPVSSIVNNDAKPKAGVEAKPSISASTGPNAKAADSKQPISGYSLRKVYDGLALLEGHGGMHEVGPGDSLPGAGKVLAIEKNGRKWVVVTDHGQIEGQSSSPQSHHSQQHYPDEPYFDERF